MKRPLFSTLLIAFALSPLANADNWQPLTGADTLQQFVSGATAEIELRHGVTAIGKYHADGTAEIEAEVPGNINGVIFAMGGYAGDVTITFEMKTPPERAAPAEVNFWINGKEAVSGTIQRTVPAGFTASETFDVGMDTSSPVANDYFDKAPFEFEGYLKRLYFENQ